jgi:hypothetical protein
LALLALPNLPHRSVGSLLAKFLRTFSFFQKIWFIFHSPVESVGKHADDTLKPPINTASLHRFLFLAQQAREQFMQRTAQLASAPSQFGFAPSLFVFDPFRDEQATSPVSNSGGPGFQSSSASSTALSGPGKMSAAERQEKSRFGFAQQQQQQGSLTDTSDLATKFDQAFSLGADKHLVARNALSNSSRISS